jgi:hypothetical protein
MEEFPDLREPSPSSSCMRTDMVHERYPQRSILSTAQGSLLVNREAPGQYTMRDDKIWYVVAVSLER